VQALANQGATFTVGAKLPKLSTPGGSIGFSVTPSTVFSLCGFKLLLPFSLKLGLVIPSLEIPLPDLFAALGINCDLKHPLNFAAGIGYGGGRVGRANPDPDDQEG
jgi:hypothetical protein